MSLLAKPVRYAAACAVLGLLAAFSLPSGSPDPASRADGQQGRDRHNDPGSVRSDSVVEVGA